MKYFALMLAVIALSGCGSSRSISLHPGNWNYMYNGELSQMDVISSLCDVGSVNAKADIGIKTGAKVILIQSGQMSPEASVTAALSGLDVLPFSGVPSHAGINGTSWRQAAKMGDVDTVIVYWGDIEASVTNKKTKAISWVPVIGWAIPDESSRMRVVVKAIVADMASGRWTLIKANSSETEITSSIMTRESTDEKQIGKLKLEAFDAMTAGIKKLIK